MGALLLLAAACGGESTEGPAAIDPSWIDKAFFAGDRWHYTRTYEGVVLPGISVGVSVVLQEALVIAWLPSTDPEGRDEVVAAWALAGHVPETGCEPQPPMGTVVEPGYCPWHVRTHVVMDWGRVIPVLDRLEAGAVATSPEPWIVSGAVEDGLVDALSRYSLRLAGATEAQSVLVHERLERVDDE